MHVPGEGPSPARVMIVGEAPGFEEERSGHPFVGASGRELDKMLHEAGLLRSECFVTNVSRQRPPDNKIEAWLWKPRKGKPTPSGFVQLRNLYVHPAVKEGFDFLLREIELVKPNVIIAAGNLPMWVLTGRWGISKWRGSHLRVDWDRDGPIVIPTWHPAYILRDWAERASTVRDLRRAASLQQDRNLREPEWNFLIRPTFEQAVGTLEMLLGRCEAGPTKLVNDLETRGGHIACSGLAWSQTEAICIPFMDVSHKEGFWSSEQEAHLIWLHYKLFTHPNARLVNQNYLYDAQYIHRWWCFKPGFWRDTMISHHVAFCALPKNVAYQASLYCAYYQYWKDDSRDWDPKVGEDQLWKYCCMDTVYTWEVDEVTSQAVKKMGLEEVNKFQQDLFHCTLRTMNYGIRLDSEAKTSMKKELEAEADKRQAWLDEVFGHHVDTRSPQAMMRLFYDDLKQPVQINRATKKPTINEEALFKLARREPILSPVVKCITELRSIGVFISTFINARLDLDGRLRCSFNPCGTYTFRYSSSKNAFWNGCVPANAEVLTKKGWKWICELLDDEEVAQWEPSGTITFAPAEKYSTDYSGDWYIGEGEQFSFCYTDGHRVPTYNKYLQFQGSSPAAILSWKNNYAIPLSGKLAKGTVSYSYPRILAATLADGSYEGNLVRISFKRKRKVARFLEIAKDSGLHFWENSAQEEYRRFVFQRPVDWPTEKAWGSWVLNLTPQCAETLIEESRYWDSHSRDKSFIFYAASKEQADWVATLAHLTNRSAAVRKQVQSAGSWSETVMWAVNVKPRHYARVSSKHWKTEPYEGKVYCVTVPSSYFLMRYKGKICVTGNTNLQNIPKGVEAREPEDLELPNIRKLFVPDPGFTFFDMDLDRADAQVVAWEADDAELKAIMREGADLHEENAKALGIGRQLAKSWVHGTNYGGGPRTMAVTCGLTVHKAEQMQARWFQAHPGIKRWHERTQAQVNAKGFVSNIFGYRWYLFDRLNLPDALAWQPQSVVGRVINTAWQRIHAEAPEIQVLLQVHDSLAGQFPTHLKSQTLIALHKLAQVTIPYPDPLVIPVGIKTSEVSWGACV